MTPKPPFSRILVGYDAERDDEAVRAGVYLARRLGLELDLVHVVPQPGMVQTALDPEGTDEAVAREIVASRDDLLRHTSALLRELWPDGPDAGRVTHVIPGKPAKALAEFATEHAVDVIILGPHQRHGFLDLANTVRKLMRRSPCALWDQMIPFRRIGRILFATDLSDESLSPLPRVRDLAAVLGARLTVLHCFVPPAFAYDPAPEIAASTPMYVVDTLRAREKEAFWRKMDGIDWGTVRHEHVFAESEPERAIADLAPKTDLVTLATHGRAGLARFVLGNLASSVLERGTVPVLAFPAPDLEPEAPPRGSGTV
jgi:nucleotide-binding universal stress UspA family protein